VLGRDDLVTSAADIVKGTNAMVLGPLLGKSSADPSPGSSVHLDDVAEIHVRALQHNIPGNTNYIATANAPTGIQWADALALVKREFADACEKGLFTVNGAEEPKTLPSSVGSSLTEKTFGIKFKGFDEQVRSLAEHYLELRGEK
jgi:hypothetical protein